MKKYIILKHEKQKDEPKLNSPLPSSASGPPLNSAIIPMQEVMTEELTKTKKSEENVEVSCEQNKSKDVCRDFIRESCTRESCKFLHVPTTDVNQLRPVYKFCRHFQNAICTYVNCRFVHASKTEQIKFYRTGYLPKHLMPRRVPPPQPPQPPVQQPPPQVLQPPPQVLQPPPQVLQPPPQVLQPPPQVLQPPPQVLQPPPPPPPPPPVLQPPPPVLQPPPPPTPGLQPPPPPTPGLQPPPPPPPEVQPNAPAPVLNETVSRKRPRMDTPLRTNEMNDDETTEADYYYLLFRLNEYEKWVKELFLKELKTKKKIKHLETILQLQAQGYNVRIR